MQPFDKNIQMLLSIKTHMHTNTFSIKLLYIILWKHHTHKDNVIHAHASFRSFTPYCQVPWDVNPHIINPFTPYCQVPWDVKPHLIIVCPCCSCFMFHAHDQLVYYYFHAHAIDTYFQYKTTNNSTHQFINQYLRNLNLKPLNAVKHLNHNSYHTSHS
jgi:hypothetical protein